MDNIKYVVNKKLYGLEKHKLNYIIASLEELKFKRRISKCLSDDFSKEEIQYAINGMYDKLKGKEASEYTKNKYK